MLRSQNANQFLIPGQRQAHGDDQLLCRFFACALGLHCRNLRRVELPAFEIGRESLGAPGKMLGMEARRRHPARRSPKLFDAQRRNGAFQIFTDMFTRSQKMSDDGVYPGDNTPHPGFR
jgi:hypothetical protein